ncbi:MAG: flippase [Patescibacteria group bacterium]
MFGKIKSLFLENRTLRQTVFKNAFWLSVGNFGSRFIHAAIIIYAARILGASEYGVFSYALGLASFFVIFSDIGISQLLTREVAKHPDKARAYISTSFAIKIFFLASVIILMLLIAPHFSKIPEAKTLIPIIAMLLIFDGLRNFGFAITRAQNRMELETLFTVLTDISITTISFFVLFANPSAERLAWGYAAGSGLGLVMLGLALRNWFKNLAADFDKKLVIPIISSAWPLAIVGLFSIFTIDIDTIIIGWFLNASDLGLYGVAQRPVQLIYALPALLATSLFPILSKLIHSKEVERVRAINERSFAISFGLAIPLTFGGIVLGKQIIYALFGAEYLGAVLTFQLLLFTVILVSPEILLGNLFFAYGFRKIFIVAAALGAVTNVVFDFLFIPRYGIAGSVVATILAHIAILCCYWFKMRQIHSFKIIFRLSRIIPASLLMIVLTSILSRWGINVFLNIGISATTYFFFLYLFKEPLISEVKKVWKAA